MFKELKNLLMGWDKEEGKVEETPNHEKFIPQTLDEYIGQRRLKNILSKYTEAVNERNIVFPHIILYAKPGMGKTTLVKIIANLLGVYMTETLGVGVKNVNHFLKMVEAVKGGIVFLDEVHGIGRDEAEALYTIMDHFTHKNTNITPFTLIGATTEIGEIIKNRKPFYDRFGMIIELEDYTIGDLVNITRQYKLRTFPYDNIMDYIYEIIAKNSRGTPRTLIRLLTSTIYFKGDIEGVMESFSIIKDGYTEKDLKLLEYLESEKIVGLQGLSAYLDTSIENYLYEIEPYLLKSNVISRTPRGRKITFKGIELIGKLKEG